MNVRSGRRHQRFLVFVGLGLLACLAAPQIASADSLDDITGTVGDAVNQTTDTTNEVVNQTADTTNEVVNQTTDTTNEVVNQTTDTTNEVVNQTTETTNEVVNQTTETTNEVENEVAGTVDESGPLNIATDGGMGSTSGSSLDPSPNDETGAAPRHGGSAIPQSEPARWWTVRGFTEPAVAAGYEVGSGSEEELESQTDPCEVDQRLVCLGILYGLGDFGDVGAEVLGILVRTGTGAIGLMLLVVALAVGGSAALAASSRERGLATRPN
jgi:ElaB/YqjD/DUF883 family membrane-anchored ribosome-binding protein